MCTLLNRKYTILEHKICSWGRPSSPWGWAHIVLENFYHTWRSNRYKWATIGQSIRLHRRSIRLESTMRILQYNCQSVKHTLWSNIIVCSLRRIGCTRLRCTRDSFRIDCNCLYCYHLARWILDRRYWGQVNIQDRIIHRRFIDRILSRRGFRQ